MCLLAYCSGSSLFPLDCIFYGSTIKEDLDMNPGKTAPFGEQQIRNWCFLSFSRFCLSLVVVVVLSAFIISIFQVSRAREGNFSVRQHSTDPWRGYYETKSDKYSLVNTAELLAWHESEKMLKDFDERIRELFDEHGIDYARVACARMRLNLGFIPR